MPYIKTTTTAKIDNEKKQALTEAFGRAIELIPGKSERWLMLGFFGEVDMTLAGTAEGGAAMIEVQLLGSASSGAKSDLTAALTSEASSILGVSPGRIYINYSEFDTWGWNGQNL